VLPIVNQVEGDWIDAFEGRSAFAALGTTQNSTLGSRPFVESMCHDRWTAQPGWLGAPHFEEPVMAITFEGTYGLGPDGVSWNTTDDYRQMGREMGMAMFDHFDLSVSLTASAIPYGSSCGGVALNGFLTPTGGGSHFASLVATNGTPNTFVIWLVGWQQAAVPLPSPWAGCTLYATLDATAAGALDGFGAAILPLSMPAASGLEAFVQAFTLDLTLTSGDSSNGLKLQNNY